MTYNYPLLSGNHKLGETGRLIFDKYRIKKVLGVAGDCIESTAVRLGTKTFKFAFYNTGELCQASFEENSLWMKVECLCLPSRCTDVLGWLKTYLVNGMEELGYGTNVVMHKDHFFARFYKEEK